MKREKLHMIDKSDTADLCVDKSLNLKTGRPIKDFSQIAIKGMIILTTPLVELKCSAL